MFWFLLKDKKITNAEEKRRNICSAQTVEKACSVRNGARFLISMIKQVKSII